jgi:hypothetical protein
MRNKALQMPQVEVMLCVVVSANAAANKVRDSTQRSDVVPNVFLFLAGDLHGRCEAVRQST